MTSKQITAGKTQKRGRSVRLPRRRTSKYAAIKDVVSKMTNGHEHIVNVPKGVDSERFRNNLYHALRECRNDGWLSFSRTEDMKSIIISFEKSR